MTWNNNFLSDIEKELGQRIEKAAIHLTNTIKENINRSQPYSISTGEGKHYHGDDPSNPGEFPKKVRGDLQRSITYEMATDKQSAKIGTNLDYGFFLEMGTSQMAPRPFLRRTLIEERETINKILAG